MAELQVIVNQHPGKITSNFEEIKSIAISKTQALSGVIVTEDTVKDTKKDIAEFRGYQKEVNLRRVEAKKEFLKPFETFESQCKEVIEILEQAIEPMDKQVKEFDEKQKADKKAKALEYFKCSVGKVDIAFDEVFSSSWLLTNTSFKSIKSDIDTAISDRKADIETIKAMNSEVEEKAMATYKTTKRLADALRVINDYEAQKRAILEAEERRRREEEERIKREEERKAREEQERLAKEQRERELAAERERQAEIERIRAEERAKAQEEVRRQQEEIKSREESQRVVEKEESPFSIEEETSISEAPFHIADEVPFPVDKEKQEESAFEVKCVSVSPVTTVRYMIKGTEEQHKQVEKILSELGVKFAKL